MRFGKSTATLTASYGPNDDKSPNGSAELDFDSFSLIDRDDNLQQKNGDFQLNYDLTFVVNEPVQQESAIPSFVTLELTSLLFIGIALFIIGLSRKVLSGRKKRYTAFKP